MSRYISNGIKICPWCAEQIKEEAKVCKHCGRFIDSLGNRLKYFLQNIIKKNQFSIRGTLVHKILINILGIGIFIILLALLSPFIDMIQGFVPVVIFMFIGLPFLLVISYYLIKSIKYISKDTFLDDW